MKTKPIFIIGGVIIIVAVLGLVWYFMPKPDPAQELHTVTLYHYDMQKDTAADGVVACSPDSLVAVERKIRGTDPIHRTLELLLEGDVSREEQAAGLSTEFPLSGVSLGDTTLQEGGTLHITIVDEGSRTSGGACRVGLMRGMIEKTALQFPEVRAVVIAPDEVFQP